MASLFWPTLYFLPSIASALRGCRARRSFSTTSLQVFLRPTSRYSMYFHPVVVTFLIKTRPCHLTTAVGLKQQPFNGRLSGTTPVGRYQKKYAPAHAHPGQRTSFITFLHLQRSMASSLFGLRAWQSSLLSDNLFPGPLWSSPWSWALNFIHFFTPR